MISRDFATIDPAGEVSPYCVLLSFQAIPGAAPSTGVCAQVLMLRYFAKNDANHRQLKPDARARGSGST